MYVSVNNFKTFIKIFYRQFGFQSDEGALYLTVDSFLFSHDQIFLHFLR
jgi:hypothetical protein